MIAICRTRTLRALRAALDAARAEADRLRQADAAARSTAELERDVLRRELDAARDALETARAEATWVYVVLHYGEVHSAHATQAAAMAAADAAGALGGWVLADPEPVSAREEAWLVRALPLGSAR